MPTYLYSYEFEGRKYGFDIEADSKEEADARLAVFSARAKYDGVLVARIPAAPGAGWLVRAVCAVRNFFSR